jgi:hypothetical protein
MAACNQHNGHRDFIASFHGVAKRKKTLIDDHIRRNIVMPTSEFDNFDKAIDKILSVSRDEYKRREEEWKKEHGRTRGKRKPKTSASVRASSSKD